MASQVLSGAANASYTNNTGQNVRLIINYMQNVTRMTWAGVTVNAESTTIGKDIQNITGEFRSAVIGKEIYNGDVERALNFTPQTGPYNFVTDFIRANEITLSSEKTVYSFVRPGTGGFAPVGPTTLSALSYLRNTGTQTGAFNSLIIGNGQPNVPFSPYNLGLVTDTPITPLGANIFYVPRTISRGGNFPVELMLAPNQAFSAVCGAFNAVVIKEDGT